MMNISFVRRVTSSVITSLLTFTFGIGSVKSVDAQDTNRLKFCRDNPNLFHLNEGKEKNINVAVLNFENNKIITKEVQPKSRIIETKISGLGNILESKLVNKNGVEENQFTVVRWNTIKSRSTNQSVSLEELRKIRDKNGVEAVIIVTVIGFDTDKEINSGWLVTKAKKIKKIGIQLNLQVLDTTTGKIVLEFSGYGNESRDTLTEVKLPFNVYINRNITREYDSGNRSWNTAEGSNSSIVFRLGGDVEATTIHKRENNITEELLLAATEEALNSITSQLKFYWQELACKLRKPTMVARVDLHKNQVILNKGKSHGFCEGMIFSIKPFPKKATDSVVDPATGEVIIGFIADTIGEIELKKIYAGYSVGEIKSTESGKSIQRKDIAKLNSDVNCADKT